jgi:hypothetical protein
MEELRYRQIHLDFHTSEYIQEIAKNFQAKEFADILKQAYVDSVTCFARCHHGWLYYPSRRNPELIHPQLENHNLLLEQIEACHKIGIKVPVYTTVRWDARVMREHPEWLCVDENGDFIDMQGTPEPHFYNAICLNSGYRNFFKEHLLDIIDVVGVENLDGIFMDIVVQVDCNCQHCREKIIELEMNPDSKEERLVYASRMLGEFKQEIATFIWDNAPNISVFFNDSRLDTNTKKGFQNISHLELESLPSGSWGYDHFPATIRYARTLGKDIIGMTGKFHTYWGDFHSLKNKAALEFECFQMLAMGTGCSVGDQLHPNGVLSKATYQLIGSVYESVAKKEKYCKGAIAKSEIAVLTPIEFQNNDLGDLGIPRSLVGAVRMLQELAYQFDIIDSDAVFENYRVVILPDTIPYSTKLENILQHYVKNGGCVLGTFDACLSENALSTLYGIKYCGRSAYSREFIMPNADIGKNLPKEEFVMYERGNNIEAVQAQVLMNRISPYFERGGERFCSHQHAPSSGNIHLPEVTKKGNVIYCAHPLFGLYRKNAAVWCKRMVQDILEILLPHKLVVHDGPSTLLCTLNTLKEQNCDILHLLHYITEKRSEDIFTIEDIIPLYDTEFQLYTESRVVLGLEMLPEEIQIPFRQEKGYIGFHVKKIEGHQMIRIRYADEGGRELGEQLEE